MTPHNTKPDREGIADRDKKGLRCMFNLKGKCNSDYNRGLECVDKIPKGCPYDKTTPQSLPSLFSKAKTLDELRKLDLSIDCPTIEGIPHTIDPNKYYSYIGGKLSEKFLPEKDVREHIEKIFNDLEINSRTGVSKLIIDSKDYRNLKKKYLGDE